MSASGQTAGPIYVTREDPRYYDATYWPTPDAGQHWADARREQVAAINAREAESRRTRAPRPQARQNLDVLGILSDAGPIWDRSVFAQLVPAKPYCTDHLGHMQIRPRETALRRRYVQLNGPSAYTWLTFDVDRRDARQFVEFGDVPLPTIVTVNPATTHAHVAYLLGAPVTNFVGSRESPLHYLAAVERGLRRRLGADRAYNGIITQNPLHQDWDADWLGCYGLSELAKSLTRAEMRPEPRREHQTGIGRNCDVFDDTREWAYSAVLRFKRDGGTQEQWRERCQQIAAAHNTFVVPLPHSEVRSIGKSVAKWTWNQFTEAAFSRIQTARIRRRWADHEAASKTKPWVAMGISRATYHRHKRAGIL